MLVAVSSTLGVLISLSVVVVIVLLIRRRKTGDTTESVDINHDYHQEDYDDSHAVVKDINEYYDLP